MLIEIIKHVPIWVFFLFALLVRLGFVLSRDREVAPARAVIVPMAMAALSVAGVVSAFPGMLLPIAAWGMGMLFSLGLCVALGYPSGVEMIAGRVRLPGSWVPLALMMGIFFTKFAVGMSLAQQPALAHVVTFAVPVSLIYGSISGAFLIRALSVLRLLGKPQDAAVTA